MVSGEASMERTRVVVSLVLSVRGGGLAVGDSEEDKEEDYREMAVLRWHDTM